MVGNADLPHICANLVILPYNWLLPVYYIKLKL